MKMTDNLLISSYCMIKLLIICQNKKVPEICKKYWIRSSLFLLLLYNNWLTKVIDASVAKLVDARDLKSLDLTVVPVRLRPEAP
jgi:hypothetical protein